MATLGSIPFRYYRPTEDDYLLPSGQTVPAWRVRDARRYAQDAADAARGYDPYNYTGRLVA